MLLRISISVLAVVIAAGVFRADVAHAKAIAPLQLTSLEWLVADSDAILRGTVVDVALDNNWNIVTLDVLETLKGDKVQRVKFVAHKYDKSDAALVRMKASKREVVWLLKRHDSGVPGEAPDREKMLARHKLELHAPFLSGRPWEPWLPVIPLGSQIDEKLQTPQLLTINLQLLTTSDELIQAIRTTIADTQGQPRVHSYNVYLPQEVAQRTGFARGVNFFMVPVDRRLEACARRLVQAPGDFLTKANPHLLRMEGVKALRLFPSETNLAIVRPWLDDPMSTQRFKDERTTLVPPSPSNQKTEQKITLPHNLADVPEIHFQRPLVKAVTVADAQLHTAVTIDIVHLLNQKKTDAFIETLMSKRPDLAGLSFAMGDACRMKPEASRQFVAALDVFQKSASEDAKKVIQMPRYRQLATEKKIDPSASVASLMQVLGHEAGDVRLGLAKYLAELANVDATRALAKLAIFSAEVDIRTEAVNALKQRDAKDYTEILLTGLKYPWPAVAERASEALVKLERKDLVPHLIDVLDRPDPRAPQTQVTNGKKVPVVRELVRLNHHHNCLLCHAPATASRDNVSKTELAKLEGLTAQVPVPSESMVAYYRPSNPDILVRFDVTYLRQDFSLKLRVPGADPWPEMQRYDYLVRTREVTEKEALAYQELLRPNPPELSPYHRAAVAALRQLTGRDAEPTASAWRKATSTH